MLKMVISEFAYHFSLTRNHLVRKHMHMTHNYNSNIIMMLFFLLFQLSIIICNNCIMYQIYVCVFSQKKKIQEYVYDKNPHKDIYYI